MPGCQQREVRLYMEKPSATMSFAFFSPSLANCVRLGLLMSPTRQVGWPPTLFGTYLTFGSWTTGLGLPGGGPPHPPRHEVGYARRRFIRGQSRQDHSASAEKRAHYGNSLRTCR